MGEIIVNKTGLHTSIQDIGRENWRHFGVPVSGAMDLRSARLANLLTNNEENTPVIEITMIGPELQFTEPAIIALTGANLSPNLDGKIVRVNQNLQVMGGQTLSFGKPIQGIRTYLSIKGGFDCPKVLGSYSQFPMVTLSGNLQEGDRVTYRPQIGSSKNHAIVHINPQHFTSKTLKAHPGPEFDLLSDQARQMLLNKGFHINANNRMGYQLTHPGMPPHQLEIVTAPVIPGTVQLTPSGQLIALMRDAQVTGGYPRVLQLTKEGVDQLAQKTNGQSILFQLIEVIPPVYN
ncbi:MAG: biotin-dependent carboxyltransferase family protein [Marinoscillum sp.]|uniref:5-oxoprolinase subunit C family protein n=1 Tax=Marinoscillum sp. TaxID=2024838 RepID=UPI003300DA34